MMSRLFSAYREGRIQEVWQKILDLNQSRAVMDERMLEDVTAVLAEIMARSRRNVEAIVCELTDLGYRFMDLGPAGLEEKSQASRFPVHRPAAEHACSTKLAEFEKLIEPYGIIPLSFRMFLQSVGSVDFVGCFPNWSDRSDLPLLDPLQVFPLDELISYHQFLINNSDGLPKDEHGYYVQFAHDENTKDGIAGSGVGYGMRVYPERRVEGDLVNYGYTLGFVNYLRLCFKWGGFPNLEWFQGEVDPRFMAIITQIRGGLSPL